MVGGGAHRRWKVYDSQVVQWGERGGAGREEDEGV